MSRFIPVIIFSPYLYISIKAIKQEQPFGAIAGFAMLAILLDIFIRIFKELG
jgi:hypothetical protein